MGAAALSLGALALVRANGGGPSLYDGLCSPARYLALGSVPAPPSATVTYSRADMLATQGLSTSDGPPPQAQVIMAAGTLSAAPVDAVTVAITPVPAPSTRPDGTIVGNAYRIGAASAGQAVSPAPGKPVTVGLAAATTAAGPLTMQRFDGVRWTALRTFPDGCSTFYEAVSASFGVFALVGHGSPGAFAEAGGPLLVIGLTVAGAVVLVIGVRPRQRSPTG